MWESVDLKNNGDLISLDMIFIDEEVMIDVVQCIKKIFYLKLPLTGLTFLKLHYLIIEKIDACNNKEESSKQLQASIG